jgi:hypothetical protein
MKKLMLICAVVLGFAVTVSAQNNQKAEFKFDEEVHNFGKIPQGKPVTTEFAFTNIGVEPLIITDVHPQCGCTIADYTKAPVKRGERGVIKITYNAAVPAPFTKTVAVTSNAKTPQKTLIIKGEVVEAAAAPSTR